MNNELKVKRTHKDPIGKLANTALTCCFVAFLFAGGGCARCEKECAELRNLIEQNARRQDAKVSQISGRLMELDERINGLSIELKIVSRSVSEIETTQNRYKEDLANQSNMLEKKSASLLNRFETLSRQVTEHSNSVRQFEYQIRQLERQRQNAIFPDRPQGVAQSQVSSANAPEMSLDDLRQKIDRNLMEIKQLVQQNPACYINPKVTSIINLEKKIATAKDRRYCNCNNVKFVREAFYCTGCKRITPYKTDDQFGNGYGDGRCDVCRQTGFYRWLDARKRVDETTLINHRIDELYAENESLEKKILSMKHLPQRR